MADYEPGGMSGDAVRAPTPTTKARAEEPSGIVKTESPGRGPRADGSSEIPDRNLRLNRHV